MNTWNVKRNESKRPRQHARSNRRTEEMGSAIALRDELRDYVRLTRRLMCRSTRKRPLLLITRRKVAFHVMVRADDRYSLEQKGGGMLENVRVSLTKVQLDHEQMLDAVLDWLAMSSDAHSARGRARV